MTVSYIWSVGKTTVLKGLIKGQVLQLLSSECTNLTDVVREATEFIAAYYESKEKSIIATVQYVVWARSTAKKNASSCLKLKSTTYDRGIWQASMCSVHTTTS